MAADFIKLQRDQSAATECAELLQFIKDLRSVYERGTRIRAKMRHNFDDSVGEANINWATLETIWGVPVGSGQNPSIGTNANGKKVFSYIDGTVGSMEGNFQTADAKNLTETVG